MVAGSITSLNVARIFLFSATPVAAGTSLYCVNEKGLLQIVDTTVPEGAVVSIVIQGDEESFTLTPEQEEKIAQAIGQVERGEGIPADEFWAKLKRSR